MITPIVTTIVTTITITPVIAITTIIIQTAAAAVDAADKKFAGLKFRLRIFSIF